MASKKVWLSVIILAFILSLSAPSYAASEEADQVPLYLANSAEAIPDRYIVVFRSGTSQAGIEEAAKGISAQAGVTIHHVYTSALQGFAATLTASALGELRSNSSVEYIEADQVMTINTDQSPATWGLDRVDQRNLPLNNIYTYNDTGAGVSVYIIDTGIRITHSQFGGRAFHAFDSIGDGQNGNDCHGHGTHVAGTVGGSNYGIAKDVSLFAVRVLNCSGSGSTSGVIAGVDYVTASHNSPAVANMSLGGPASSALDSAVRNSINSGVTYAVAAGNENSNACRRSPARVGEALTVGATTSTDNRASYSNYGSCLDLFAPGSSITSAWNSSDSAINTISGTSMATPHVAGVAALYLEDDPDASPSTVASAIIGNATPGVVINPGRKSPNLLLYSQVP